METSAKVNDGVEEAFFTLARCVLPRSCGLSLTWRGTGISRHASLIRKQRVQGHRAQQPTGPLKLTSPRLQQRPDAAHELFMGSPYTYMRILALPQPRLVVPSVCFPSFVPLNIGFTYCNTNTIGLRYT